MNLGFPPLWSKDRTTVTPRLSAEFYARSISRLDSTRSIKGRMPSSPPWRSLSKGSPKSPSPNRDGATWGAGASFDRHPDKDVGELVDLVINEPSKIKVLMGQDPVFGD